MRYAYHWNFRIRACRPYRAQTKGKVERPIRYLRESFFYGRTFTSDDDLNAQALHWLETEANVRSHGTLKERPLDRFERERLLLEPLATRPYHPLVPASGSLLTRHDVLAGHPRRATSPHGLCPDRGRGPMKAAARSRRDRIRAQLADLKMPGALEAIDDVLTGVDGGGVTASEAIEQLLGAQITLRNNRRLQAAMRSSRLPGIKILDDFDFSFQPSIKREQIDSLHELGFLERKENVIFLGPPGVGKTHLAISLAIAAAQSGAQSLLRRSGRPHHLARRSQDHRPAGTPPQDPHLSFAPGHRPRSATCRSARPAPCSSSNSSTGAMSAHPLC